MSFWGAKIKIDFFFQKGILVTYHLQNDIILIFPFILMVTTNRVAKMQLFDSLGGYFITFETSES
jgi:hypothetical protein